MSCGIVKSEQGLKEFYTCLRSVAAEFLRFVQNYNRTVSRYNVNRTTAAKAVLFAINNSRRFVFCTFFQRRRKCLSIDNHNVNIFACGEVIKLVKVFAVVYEIARLFPVMLKEVIFHYLKRFLNTFTNSNRRNDNNKLAPTVMLVEFKNSFYVAIGFTGSRFHFNI